MLKTVMTLLAAGAIAGAVGPVAAQTSEGITSTADPGYLRGQDQIELTVTDLLNRLSGFGFAQYRRIERIGDDYLVEVMTRDFEVKLLRVDARSGAITVMP